MTTPFFSPPPSVVPELLLQHTTTVVFMLWAPGGNRIIVFPNYWIKKKKDCFAPLAFLLQVSSLSSR